MSFNSESFLEELADALSKTVQRELTDDKEAFIDRSVEDFGPVKRAIAKTTLSIAWPAIVRTIPKATRVGLDVVIEKLSGMSLKDLTRFLSSRATTGKRFGWIPPDVARMKGSNEYNTLISMCKDTNGVFTTNTFIGRARSMLDMPLTEEQAEYLLLTHSGVIKLRQSGLWYVLPPSFERE